MDENNISCTGGYDGSILVWDLDTLECVGGMFGGHKDAVLTFEWRNSLLVSGGKDGSVALWDINREDPVQTSKPHDGFVSKIAFFSDQDDTNIILTAGVSDGILAVHDMRTNKIA